jgi:hypothetical protein
VGKQVAWGQCVNNRLTHACESAQGLFAELLAARQSCSQVLCSRCRHLHPALAARCVCCGEGVAGCLLCSLKNNPAHQPDHPVCAPCTHLSGLLTRTCQHAHYARGLQKQLW